MVILDSNIIIYLANGELPKASVAEVSIAYASVSRIEALGYAGITMPELLLTEALLNEAQSLELSEPIIAGAIQLRQLYRMTLGDAIIAATALEYNLELWTRNIKDFRRVDGLKLHDPFEGVKIK